MCRKEGRDGSGRSHFLATRLHTWIHMHFAFWGPHDNIEMNEIIPSLGFLFHHYSETEPEPSASALFTVVSSGILLSVVVVFVDDDRGLQMWAHRIPMNIKMPKLI